MRQNGALLDDAAGLRAVEEHDDVVVRRLRHVVPSSQSAIRLVLFRRS